MKIWRGKRVLVIGAARQGAAATRYLFRQGATVTLNDHRPAEDFLELRQEFVNQPIQWQFGGHPLSLLDGVDLVIVSGGVPLGLLIIQEAQKRGIPITNDSQIFMETVQAKVIGITGSAGKTTTTLLVGEIAKAAAQPGQQVWVGGNIGYPLIDHVEEIKPNDLVATELSSFQLELMTISPHIAAVLNITPNHLDRHGSMQAYTQAKSRILHHQVEQDMAVLSREDPGAWGLANLVKGKLVTFGFNKPANGINGTYLKSEKLFIQDKENQSKIMNRSEIQLKGEHNLMNTLAACAIAHTAGFSTQSMREGICQVKGVPHRLEFVRDWNGSLWYNDSIATAPERATAAIRSFDQPLILLLGGRDKNLPWDELAYLVRQRVKHVVLFGEAANLIAGVLGEVKRGQFPLSITRCTSLKEAVKAAADHAEKGDVVLLAPGGTSFDEFRDFEERGQQFMEWVKALA